MDLRKTIRVGSYHEIDVPMGEPYTVDDEDGNEVTEYTQSDQYTLADILSQVQSAGIPESEFDKVMVRVGYERGNDPYLVVEYRKPKTQKEMDDELEAMRKEYDKAKKAKELKHQEKMKKKAEKQKIIDSLTPEQRKALGYGNSVS